LPVNVAVFFSKLFGTRDMNQAFVTATRSPASRFTQLGDLKDGAGLFNVQGVVTQCYDAEKTAGTDFKSVLMIIDPSVPEAVKVNLFFPRMEDHPCLSQARMGDVFRGSNATITLFRSKLQLTFSAKNGSTYEILDGEHNNLAVQSSEAEMLFLRDFRLELIAKDTVFAKRCMGPGPYVHFAYPRPATDPNPRSIAPLAQPVVHAQSNRFVVPMPSAPPPVRFVAPVSHAAPVVSAVPAASSKKSLVDLTFPVNGARGYFADLGAVRLLSINEPVQGKRLCLMLWDGTGPRPNSLTPKALAETVQATCWEPAMGKVLLACGAGSWVELGQVRVSPHKQKEGELEVHINDASIVRALAETDPVVVERLKLYAEKEARQTASKVLDVFSVFVLV
jgi:hypothetical protein